jgi:RNA 3'-terminal phosphate cyclase (ATP)
VDEAVIAIDGDQGEGGGQVLRTSLALAAHTGQAFHATDIRARRSRPGLLRQHLTAVKAAAEICDAEVVGAELGSRELLFQPRAVRPGEYTFAVGTAGSATLVLQTVLPALMLADAPSVLTLRGGTHNPKAPPWHFLATVFLPLVERMGPSLPTRLRSWGFYPAGGGDFTIEVHPVARLAPLELRERGAFRQVTATAAVSALPRAIAERELAVIGRLLELDRRQMRVIEVERSPGPGNCCWITAEAEGITELATAFGEKRLSSETVAETCAREHLAWRTAGAPVGEHLADQLLVPLALAGAGRFRTGELSQHTTTNMEVIRQFLPVRFERTSDGGQTEVAVAAR